MQFMVSVIQYGGRITDDFDKLLMTTYAARLFMPVGCWFVMLLLVYGVCVRVCVFVCVVCDVCAAVVVLQHAHFTCTQNKTTSHHTHTTHTTHTAQHPLPPSHTRLC